MDDLALLLLVHHYTAEGLLLLTAKSSHLLRNPLYRLIRIADQLNARMRLIIRKKGFEGFAIWFTVPARYIDRDGQTKAKDPVDPEWPANSGSGVGQKKRGNWKYIIP